MALADRLRDALAASDRGRFASPTLDELLVLAGQPYDDCEARLAEIEEQLKRPRHLDVASAFDEAYNSAPLVDELRGQRSGAVSVRAVTKLRRLGVELLSAHAAGLPGGLPGLPAKPAGNVLLPNALDSLEALRVLVMRFDRARSMSIAMRTLGLAYGLQAEVDPLVARTLAAVEAGLSPVRDGVDAWRAHVSAGTEWKAIRLYLEVLSPLLDSVIAACREPLVSYPLSIRSRPHGSSTPAAALGAASEALRQGCGELDRADHAMFRGVPTRLTAHAERLRLFGCFRYQGYLKEKVENKLRHGLPGLPDTEIEIIGEKCLDKACDQALRAADRKHAANELFDGSKTVGLIWSKLFGTKARPGRRGFPGLIENAINAGVGIPPDPDRPPDGDVEDRIERKEHLNKLLDAWDKRRAGLGAGGTALATEDLVKWVRGHLRAYDPEGGVDFRIVLRSARISWQLSAEAKKILGLEGNRGVEVPKRVRKWLMPLFRPEGSRILSPAGFPEHLAEKIEEVRRASPRFQGDWQTWAGLICDWLEGQLARANATTPPPSSVTLQPLLRIPEVYRFNRGFLEFLVETESRRNPERKDCPEEANQQLVAQRYRRAMLDWNEAPDGLNRSFQLIRVVRSNLSYHRQEVVQ